MLIPKIGELWQDEGIDRVNLEGRLLVVEAELVPKRAEGLKSILKGGNVDAPNSEEVLEIGNGLADVELPIKLEGIEDRVPNKEGVEE